jgi:sec-independent protein translocase protein TatB
MIPQIGIAEMLVIAVLALIVVGPKDLPGMMRKAGQFFARMKSMGQEFKDAFNQIGEDDELAQLRQEIDELKNLGKLSNLSDEAFEEDMRELDKDLRQGIDLKKETPKPTPEKPKTEPEPETKAKPKPKTKPKAKPKTKKPKSKKEAGDGS